jgi:bifunctional non-homologous end joining protein LigD
VSEEKHVALYYKEGNSDKEYHVHLVQQGQGYVVKIEYGRRGSSLTSGTKTPVPLDLDKASAIFDKQVHEKRLKGYTEGAGQTPYVGSTKEDKITGVLPQLLNLIEEEDLDDYFDDPNFCMQEKKDGKRILLRKQGGNLEAINRKGLLVGFPQAIQDTLSKVDEDFIIDGELVGDVFFAFDALELAGTDCRSLGYRDRYQRLETFLGSILSLEIKEPIQLVAALFKSSEKRKRFQKYKAQGVEGVVFKQIDAPYKAGRPASGGDQLKFKFTQTCTCRVSGINEKGKRSVYIEMLDGKKPVAVGKVTVLPNFPVPKINTLVEIKYLYRHVHGALYQPIYLGERYDLDQPDQLSTIKIKEGIDVDEDEN